MAQTTRGVFENVSKIYGAFFSINGARKIAEVYIETNEKLAKEALDYGRKFVELSAGGARKFAVSEDLGGVAGKVADDTVDLGNRDLDDARHPASLASGGRALALGTAQSTL